MNVFLYSFLLLLIFTGKGSAFSNENYRDAFLNAPDECGKIYKSLDVITQFKFIDASAKIPVGIIQGHFNNLGAYDECLAIDIPDKNVLGKYCTAKISLSSVLKPEESSLLAERLMNNSKIAHNISESLQSINPIKILKESSLLQSFSFGICIPHQCMSDSATIKSLNIQFDESLCVTKETYDEMPLRAKIALYVIIGFFVVAVVSTIYDIVRVHQEREPHHEIFIAFSFYTNGKKLCKTSRDPSQLSCLNGLRTLNIIWVIAGHTYGSIISGPIDNYLDVIQWIHSYSSMLIVGATVAVDSFFTMGGLLTVYTLLKSEDPGLNSNIKRVPLMYIHRYLRLTPAFAFIVYITWSGLVSYIADGPMWHVIATNAETCEHSWWAALLYIQNFRSEECVGQSWYLSVDMQLFILSPLICIPLRRWPKQTLKTMFALVLLGMIVPFGLGFYYKLPATAVGFPSNGFMRVYYEKTYARFGTYVIGMIAGYYIYHAKQHRKPTINPVALFWMWLLTIAALYASVYAGFPLVTDEAPTIQGYPLDVDEATRWWNSIYLALSRTLWSSALSVLIYLCVTGYGGPVNWFLSAGPMQFISKLSYCMYLNHILFILIRIGQKRDSIHFGNWELINMLISIVMVMIPASILQTLLFESPMICIEKIIFGRGTSNRKDMKGIKNEV